MPRGWFPKAGLKCAADGVLIQMHSSWCRVCLRPLRSAHAAERRGLTGENPRRVDHAVIRELWRAQNGVCPGHDERLCGASLLLGYEIDHWWPIAHGGRHTAENLRLLCRRCNREKGARVPGRLHAGLRHG